MQFKLDENLPRSARERFEQQGWNVDDIHEEGLAGSDDSVVQAACERERRVLVTLDTDFADTRRYNPARSPGVIVLRPGDQSISSCLRCVEAAIRLLVVQPIARSLWVVEPERVRIRDHPTGA